MARTAADTAAGARLFPVAFHYSAFVVGATLLLYWIARIAVSSQICSRYKELKQEPCFCPRGDTNDNGGDDNNGQVNDKQNNSGNNGNDNNGEITPYRRAR